MMELKRSVKSSPARPRVSQWGEGLDPVLVICENELLFPKLSSVEQDNVIFGKCL